MMTAHFGNIIGRKVAAYDTATGHTATGWIISAFLGGKLDNNRILIYVQNEKGYVTLCQLDRATFSTGYIEP